MIDPGETLLDFDFGNHLYIVISIEIDGELAVVNLTTHGREERCKRRGCVILQSGDHRWVRRPSCIPYRRARMTPSKPLVEMKQRGTLSQSAPLAPIIFSGSSAGRSPHPGRRGRSARRCGARWGWADGAAGLAEG